MKRLLILGVSLILFVEGFMLKVLFARVLYEPIVIMLWNKYRILDTDVIVYNCNAIVTTKLRVRGVKFDTANGDKEGDIVSIVQQYMDGLKKAYYENAGKEVWDAFERVFHGAAKEDMEELQKIYPDIPDSLVELLKTVDGTYWREYAGEKISFYFLGSDIEEYSYYLLSAAQMREQKDDLDWLTDYINREFEDIEIDERIVDKADDLCWLHFSDCMNNGGTSQLFIDFSPSAKGIKGQIVRYLHDPDEIEVIADSFDNYLQMLIDDEYSFINEDTIE